MCSTTTPSSTFGSRVQLQGLEPALAQLRGMVNRIAVSILVGALVIGLSQFIHMVAPVGYEELVGRICRSPAGHGRAADTT